MGSTAGGGNQYGIAIGAESRLVHLSQPGRRRWIAIVLVQGAATALPFGDVHPVTQGFQ